MNFLWPATVDKTCSAKKHDMFFSRLSIMGWLTTCNQDLDISGAGALDSAVCTTNTKQKKSKTSRKQVSQFQRIE